jgi:hypothetical protein
MVSESIVLRFKNIIVFSKKSPEKIEFRITIVDPVLRKETSRLGNLELTPMTIDYINLNICLIQILSQYVEGQLE